MDKQRHPNVVRTWTVERTKVRYPSPPPVKFRSGSQKDLFRWGGEESDPPPAPATQGWPVDTAHGHGPSREGKMITASQLRTGMAIKYEGQQYKVLVANYHPGQGKMGGATHVRLQNLSTATFWNTVFAPI